MKNLLFPLVVSGLGLVLVPWLGGGAAPPRESPTLRLGVYDSRAVAVAFVHDERFGGELKQLIKERDDARARKDDRRVAELEAMGQARQDRLHRQGFSGAPIPEILEKVKEELPALARNAGVDALVSRWDLAYLADEALVIDVTGAMVDLFRPDDKTREIVRQLQHTRPVPESELRDHR